MRVPTNTIQRDYGDIASFQRQMMEASDELSSMTEEVAKAKQIKEWDSERRRAALSVQVAPLLIGNAVSASEHIARASSPYHSAMRELQLDLFSAEKTLARYEAVKCKWESARSILSMAKHIASTI